MRNLQFVLILAVSILLILKNVYCDSSNPLPKTKASPKQWKNIRWEGRDDFFYFLTHEISNKYTTSNGLRPRTPLMAPPSPPPPPPVITSYILALQWPPGVCYGDSGVTCQIKPVPTEFTIHGLWPQPNGAASSEAFDAQKIATLTTDLNKYWPNLESKQQSVSDNLKFWQDEWIKHGKYSGLGVQAYFKKSLELHKDVGQQLKTKLAAENINPNNFNTKRLVAIEAAVKKINGGFSGTIICVKRKGSSSLQQIQEIRFRYTTNFQKQDNSSPSNCPADILFPSLP